MGHELEIRGGRASMIYVGEAPWHGLGTRLERPATAAEAMRTARMDWEVVKTPVYACAGNRLIGSDRFAIVRADMLGKDDCKVLAIVGREYTPLQNRDAFRFFDPIVGPDAAVYETAGVLAGGKRIWILAKLPGEIRVAGDDVSHKYLLLFNSHDGTSAVGVKFTPIRVVCQNTLTMAITHGRTLWAKHTRSLRENLDTARRKLGIIHEKFEAIEAHFRRMAAVQMVGNRLREYLERVFPYPSNREDRKSTRRAEHQREWARRFFEEGRGNDRPGVRGTLWAAYNGVAEYIDHCVRRGQSHLRHLDRIWFGEGYSIKVRAYRAATLAEKWVN